MKTTLPLTFAIVFGALTLMGAPSIATMGVKNSASYASPSFQNGAIAQGSLFVIFGSGMGPAQIQYATSFPLPATLAGTSVNVTVGGMTLPCVMIYTEDGQVAAIMPSTTPTGTGTMTVTYNGATSPTAPVTVTANSPGLFTRSTQGTGPAVVQDVNGAYNSFVNSFQPGETVTFWGTGLGPIAGSDAMPPPSGNLPNTTVTALVGNQNAMVTYAGRSAYAGVDQVNITIPQGISGCFVSVAIYSNGVPSNFTTIAVSNNGLVCSDPNLFTAAQIQRIANGNPLRLGTSLLSQVTATGTVLGLPLKIDYERGASYYQEYTSANFLDSLTQLSDYAVSPGSCGVFEQVKGVFIDPVPYQGLNAGAAVTVTGAGGTSMTMANSALGNYEGTFSNENPLSPSTPFLVPGGTFGINNGSGGADVGAFSFNNTLPPAITWTNKPAGATISRSQDLKITWSGGDPSGFVYMVGQSPIDNVLDAIEFVCVAQNSAGGFTIPAAILSALPPSANVTELGFTIPGGLLAVSASTIMQESAPGLDVFLTAATAGDGKGAFAFQ